uniref:Uncharacterized protein n=1 Tax=Anopheles christyi TaxID=43041 RepID=A0A182KF42_9DIPT
MELPQSRWWRWRRRHLLTGSLLLLVCLLLAFDPAPVNADPDEDIPHNDTVIVRNWAIRFGVDLWEFGRQFTKVNDIRNVSICLARSK